MIHKVVVNCDTTLDMLKKEFRKRLMTGGAILQIDPNLNDEQLLDLINRFSFEVKPGNLAELCLVQIAKSSKSRLVVWQRLIEVAAQTSSKRIDDILRTDENLKQLILSDTQKRALIDETKSSLETFSKEDISEFYLANLSDDEFATLNRIALAELQILPEEILTRLKLDIDPRVRVGVRSVPKILEEKEATK